MSAHTDKDVTHQRQSTEEKLLTVNSAWNSRRIHLEN